MPLTLMYITNDAYIASIADDCGVDRIWIDLETLGKEERQRGLNSVKSHHALSDISKIKRILKNSNMLVRVNPININSASEINAVLDNGADYVMLPMWKSLNEVETFLRCVDKRAKTVLLLETKDAVDCLEEVLACSGIDEIHIGLNDLHLSYGLTFMFELLKNGMVEELCEKIKKYNIPYGFGGIAKLGAGIIPAEKIIAEHYRIGSTRAILSRSFFSADDGFSHDEIRNVFSSCIKELRNFEQNVCGYDEKRLWDNKLNLDSCIENAVKMLRENNAHAV